MKTILLWIGDGSICVNPINGMYDDYLYTAWENISFKLISKTKEKFGTIPINGPLMGTWGYYIKTQIEIDRLQTNLTTSKLYLI